MVICVIDNLSIDVVCAAKDVETGTLGGADDFLAYPQVSLFTRIDIATQPGSLLLRALLAGFAYYAPDLFAFIFNAFA